VHFLSLAARRAFASAVRYWLLAGAICTSADVEALEACVAPK
jgi:hypothetical protein